MTTIRCRRDPWLFCEDDCDCLELAIDRGYRAKVIHTCGDPRCTDPDHMQVVGEGNDPAFVKSLLDHGFEFGEDKLNDLIASDPLASAIYKIGQHSANRLHTVTDPHGQIYDWDDNRGTWVPRD